MYIPFSLLFCNRISTCLRGILFCENGANLTHHTPFTSHITPYVHSYLRCRAAPAPPPERVAPRDTPAPVRVVPARVAPRDTPAPARVVLERVAPREAPPPVVPPIPPAPAPAATLLNCLHSPAGVHVPYPTPTQSEAYMHMYMSAVPVVSALHLPYYLPA